MHPGVDLNRVVLYFTMLRLKSWAVMTSLCLAMTGDQISLFPMGTTTWRAMCWNG